MGKKWKANWVLKIEVCFCWEEVFFGMCFFGSLKDLGFLGAFPIEKKEVFFF